LGRKVAQELLLASDKFKGLSFGHDHNCLEREAWLKLSKKSLKKVRDNDADDIFNDLLEK
jgi:hypothetical protein